MTLTARARAASARGAAFEPRERGILAAMITDPAPQDAALGRSGQIGAIL